MKVLIVSSWGGGTSLGWRFRKEGHQVKMWIKPHEGKQTDVGDGFMALKEFDPLDSKRIYEFLLTLRDVTRKARRGIINCRYPKPDGFRIRITCGDVYKIMVLDTNDLGRQKEVPEYVEYATNAAAHLLAVNPEEVCLATEAVVDSIGKYRSAFRCQKLEKPSYYPESVNKQDVDGLYVFQF